MSDEKSVVATDEKMIEFYGDELIAVFANGDTYVPLRPICDQLGLAWSGQYERVNRDPVLSTVALSVRVTRTEAGEREMLCLPLKFLNGWLFGLNADRVRPELRDKIIQYQLECYDVLANAFQSQAFAASGSTLLQIREMALAIGQMAEQQYLLEEKTKQNSIRLDNAGRIVRDIGKRLTTLESKLSPASHVTDEQAAEISLKVKAIAAYLEEQEPGKNHYQSVFAELYRRFRVSSYKLIRQSQYPAVLDFLDEWIPSDSDSEVGT